VKQQEGRRTTAKGSQVNNGQLTNPVIVSLMPRVDFLHKNSELGSKQVGDGFKLCRSWVQVSIKLGYRFSITGVNSLQHKEITPSEM